LSIAGDVARAARAAGTAGKFPRNLFKADSRQCRITFPPVFMRQISNEKSSIQILGTAGCMSTTKPGKFTLLAVRVCQFSNEKVLNTICARADFVDARPGTS
jgi:hypothetical protein